MSTTAGQRTVRSLILIAVCVALSVRQEAIAQSQQGATPGDASGSIARTSDAPGPQTASSDSSTLQEVIVTAQRRTEDVQKTPLAIQVLTADDLKIAGATDAKSLTLLVPGLQVGMGGPYTQIYIRGVGDFGANSLANPGVATSLDGVYIAREAAVSGIFYDLARVEVLKGPQGTLYGQNTTGGAINVITNRPRLDRFGGSVNVETGNYGEITADGVLNVPLGDHVAVRGAFQTLNHRGYLSDGTNDAAQQSGRIEALWQPGAKLSLLVEGNYTHQGGHGDGSALRLAGPLPSSSPWLGITDPRANAAQLALAASTGLCAPTFTLNGLDMAAPPRGQLPPPPCDTGGAGPGVLLYSGNEEASFQDNTIWGTHAQLDWDLGWATLTLIPSYRYTRVDFISYPSFETYTHPDNSGETTFEARLAHSGEHLKWVAGIYDFSENQFALDDVFAGLINNSRSIETLHTKSSAAFAQATVSLTHSLRLIAGVRYNRDRKSLDGVVLNEYPALAYAPPAPGLPASCTGTAPCLSETFDGRVDYNVATWKAGVEYDLAPESMLYFTTSTGYKAGGLNDQAGTPQYKPEKVLAFELGAHNRFLDDRLQLNLELFHWKYSDEQVPFVTLDVLGNPSFTVVNAARATLNGFDLDVAAKPTSSDTLHAAIEYNNTRYDDFRYSIPLNSIVPPPVTGVTTGCPVLTGATSVVVDCSGQQLIAAPRWSGTLAWDHAFGLGSGASVLTHIDAQFASSRWLSLDFLAPQERAPSYVVETASVTYAPPRGRWELTAFVRNISNRPVFTIGGLNPWYPGGVVGATIGDPRTYGASLTVNF